jgi:tetratricopeptide (TPR) repeat protein
VGNYRELATEAMLWFENGMKLNRFDPFNYVGYAMCLHWLDRADEATSFFQKALELDPRNFIMMDRMGWHCLEVGKLLEAKGWFEKAILQARWHPAYRSKRYEQGVLYLQIIERRLNEKGPVAAALDQERGKTSGRANDAPSAAPPGKP